ncbi:MAG: chalcone isomerase family protein [Gammaproteobacteria bacterium]|nr:chalcone isomerase family protein [Gammaproteobacteria bacterium]
MRTKLAIQILSVLTLAVSSAAYSANNDDMFAMQKTEVANQELFLNGLGAVKKLNSIYYIGALYLPEKSDIDSDIIFLEKPKKVILKFAIDRVSARGFGRELAGSLKINNVPEEIAAYRNDLRKFVGFFKGIYQKGDSLAFEYVPKRGISVKLNEELIGTVTRKGFDKLLFKAFLGEKPFSTHFKKGLIGRNEAELALDLQRKYIDISN